MSDPPKFGHTTVSGKTKPMIGARARILDEADEAELEALSHRGWAGPPPRARQLPSWRAKLLPLWLPGGSFTASTKALRQIAEHAHDYKPDWEYATLAHAQLWFVGAGMCDLLVGAAPALPSLELTDAVLPDDEGLVVFEAPLAGVDADGTDHSVSVGAYMWGRCRWGNPQTGHIVGPALGISVYGPGILDDVPLMPLGGLVWPFGEDCDVEHFGGDQRDKSMAEDRRRLLALWLLSTQPGLTMTVTHSAPVKTSKSKRKRIAAGKVKPIDSAVRIVQLRRQPRPDSDAPTRSVGGRTYRHRWTVSGHWRNQAFGPHHSMRRPVYINPYLKGPDSAPLLGTEKVKSWVK